MKEKKTYKKRNFKNNTYSINQKKHAIKEERTTRVVLGIISLLALTLAIGTIHNIITRETLPTTVITLATVDTPSISPGIIIRDETAYVYNSNDFLDRVSFSVQNNTRVRQDTLVATISNTATIATLEKETYQLSNQILQLQSTRAPVSLNIQDANFINSQIRTMTNSSIYRISNPTYARSITQDINTQVNERNSILTSENFGPIASYVSQYMQNLNIISSNQREVRATNGGIVSFSLDGLEHLNPRNMQFVTYNSANAQPLSDNQGVFKIVSSNTWYVAGFIEHYKASNLSVNQNIPIFIQYNNDNHFYYNGYYTSYEQSGNNIISEENVFFREVRATVHTIEPRDGYVFVIFSIRDFMQDFINERNINFKLEDGRHTGLKISREALATRTLLMVPLNYIHGNDGDYYINIVNYDGTYTRHTISSTLPRNQQASYGYTYILQDFNSIQIGDTISKNNSTYTLNRLITDTGVFRVNNGLAMFTSIDTNSAIETKDYLILSQNHGGITVHDRIISNTSTYLVYEGRTVH